MYPALFEEYYRLDLIRGREINTQKGFEILLQKMENQKTLLFWKAVFSAVDKLKRIELQNIEMLLEIVKK